MANNLSLYKLITGEFRELLFMNTVDMMNTISHQIEDVVMNNGLAVDFYAGFQRYSHMHAQRPRYERLARVARRVYIFGIPDDGVQDYPGIEYIPLDERDALAREWFLVIHTPYFCTALLTREIEGRDTITGGRKFEGIWTFDERIVGQSYLILSQFLGQEYTPIFDRDYTRQTRYIGDIAGNLVTRLELNNIAFKHTQRLTSAANKVANMLTVDYNADDLLSSTTANLQQNLHARTVTIWMTTADEHAIELVAASGLPTNWQRQTQKIGSMKTLAGQAAKSFRTEYMPNAKAKGIQDLFDPLATSIVALPMIAEGKLQGVIQMTDAHPHAYNDSTLTSLRTLATFLAAAISTGSNQALLAAPLPALSSASVKTFEKQVDNYDLLNITSDGVLIVEPDQRLRFLNTSARELFNLNGTDLTGQPLDKLNEANLSHLLSHMPRQNEPLSAELELSTGQPVTVQIEPTYAPMSDSMFSFSEERQLSHWTVALRPKPIVLEAVPESGGLDEERVTDLLSRLQSAQKLLDMLPSLGSLAATQAEAISRISQINDEVRVMLQEQPPVEDVPPAEEPALPEPLPQPPATKLALLEQIEGQPGPLETVDLRQLMEAVWNDKINDASDGQVDLRIELPDNLPSFEGNSKHLYLAVSELVDNAIQYNPAGSQIRLIAGLADEHIIIAVRDNGNGIWPKDTSLLFDRYYRVDNPQTHIVEGEGMGLAIVKAVAENHGGKAIVESRVERGSIFLMKLPLRG